MTRRIGSFGRAALALSLLTGLIAVTPAPAPAAPRADLVRALALANAAPDWDEDDYEWYRQSLVDIAQGDSEPEVRAAAQAALDAGTVAAVRAFVDTGAAAARLLAAQRKAKDRKQVQAWAKTGGPKVKEWANEALADGDYAISEFVAWGHEVADLLDHPVVDTKAEQDRIRGRVEMMISFGGPTVVAEGSAALGTGDPVVIAAFYRSGYSVANQTDFDNREALRAAIEARNNALDAITAQAQLSAAAASARADILRANIEAMKLLDNGLAAMQLGVRASRRADQILEEDKPARAHGQKGRTADLQLLLGEATTQAQRASAAATQANGTIATAQNAAARLVQTGESHGVDWAKVTVAAATAIQAAAASAETAQHAAEATLADSLALDANANAELHAHNADKWLAAAQKQALTAKGLATVAQEQQRVAESAAARAKAQRLLAESAAQRASVHATNARNARIAAQSASANAISRSNAAVDAHTDAAKAADRENAAISRVQNAGTELQAATNRCLSAQTAYHDISVALQKAREDAIAAGQDADAATADIAAAAERAHQAYNAATAWADRAQAAAATAQREADAASAAARQSRTAAAKADQDALTARRASDKAVLAERDAVQAAEAARLDAERTQEEASAAVEESAQSAFQAEVAGQAAGAAAASAEVAVDTATTADWMARQFAGVNADARRIMQVAAEAITDSTERQTAAQKRADEAAAASAAATAAAERAVGDIKPAYDAAAQAVTSANTAVRAAVGAHNAAIDALAQANGANKAATRASQYEQSARGDSRIAAVSADNAANAAATAGWAASDTKKIQDWATSQTKDIHTFADALYLKIVDLAAHQATDTAIQAAITDQEAVYEANFVNGLLNVYHCQSQHDQTACKKVGDFLADKAQQVFSFSLSYFVDVVKCRQGIAEACASAFTTLGRITDYQEQIGAGLWLGAKNLVSGFKMLGDCFSWVVIGTDDPDFLENCGRTVDGFKQLPKQLMDHPLELIHITEWNENPGKALGLTLFDIGSFFIPGVGEIAGTAGKLLTRLGDLLPTGLGRLAEGVAVIDRVTVPLAEGASQLPGGVARLLNVSVKIESGTAKILDGVAIIDGVAYKLDRVEMRLGAVTPGQIANGVLRIEGGVVRVEGGLAKLDNAIAKVDRYTGSAEPLGDQPDGSWIGEQFKKRITLERPFNDEAKRALARAAANEPEISAKIINITDEVPGATRQGWETRLKSADSLKRKIVSAHRGALLLDAPDLVATITDNVRYSWTFESSEYMRGMLAGTLVLARHGFVFRKLRNGWADKINPYKGINITWLDPETGQSFEVQFHTNDQFIDGRVQPGSYSTNKLEHPYYEEFRNPEATAEERAAARATSEEMWGGVPTPEGANLMTEAKIRELLAIP